MRTEGLAMAIPAAMERRLEAYLKKKRPKR